MSHRTLKRVSHSVTRAPNSIKRALPPHYEWVMSHECMSRIDIHSVTRAPNSIKRALPPYSIKRALQHTFTWQHMSHLWMSHVPHIDGSCPTCEWVRSHMLMGHVTLMNESCPTYECVALMNESCHTYWWVMSHMWKSHAPRMHESYHTHEWVMSHMWMGRVTHMSTTYESYVSHIWVRQFTHIDESCHTYERVMWNRTHIHDVKKIKWKQLDSLRRTNPGAAEEDDSLTNREREGDVGAESDRQRKQEAETLSRERLTAAKIAARDQQMWGFFDCSVDIGLFFLLMQGSFEVI